MNPKYSVKSFSELTKDELYGILSLRQEIFIVEQNCPYQDADDKDQKSHHVMVVEEDSLLAYTRLVPPGISYNNYCSIGRVVTRFKSRKMGLGFKTMEISLRYCQELYGNHPIKISAQTYLRIFYSSLGFEEKGNEYLEDDIPHIAMVYHHA